MNKYEIVKQIENFAPLETQEKWDASGWICETSKKNVNKVLFALTITPSVYRQAIEQACDMIISHHPLFFVPFEYKNLDMYCSHTNLDCAKGGTTDILLETLNLKGTGTGFLRKVTFAEPISVETFKQMLIKISPKLRYVNNLNIKEIKTVEFCAGSGSEFIDISTADAFVTGDVKFHTALDAQKVVFDIGHFESEIFVTHFLKQITGVKYKGVIADEKSPFI